MSSVQLLVSVNAGLTHVTKRILAKTYISITYYRFTVVYALLVAKDH